MSKELWPLVVVFGSYRNKGEEVLKQFAERLRKHGIRAKYVQEFQKEFPRKPGQSEEEYNHDLSMYAVERADICVFIFFQAKTIGVYENLESFDQGPVMEFDHFCETSNFSKRALFVFDSVTRSQKSSSLLRGRIKKLKNEYEKRGKEDYITQTVIEPIRPSDVLNEIFREIRGFCLNAYSDYALNIKKYTLWEFLDAIEADP